MMSAPSRFVLKAEAPDVVPGDEPSCVSCPSSSRELPSPVKWLLSYTTKFWGS